MSKVEYWVYFVFSTVMWTVGFLGLVGLGVAVAT